MARENLLSLLEEFARYRRDAAIVQRRGYRREVWSYARLTGAAIGCAFALKRAGVRSGERVLLWGANWAEWVAAFWGCVLRGAVAVPMDDGANPEFVSRVVREASVKFAFLDENKADFIGVPALLLEGLSDSVRGRHMHMTARNFGEAPRPFYQTLADEPITRAHVAQILFTSGTTAEPRGVVLTHGNFLANVEPLERGIAPYRKYERWLHPLRLVSAAPLSHVFGQFMALFVAPLLGATVVFEPSANTADIFRSIKRERATALVAVPRMLDALRSGFERELESRRESARFARAYAEAEGKPFLRRAWIFRRIHRRLGWRFWAFISGGAALGSGTEDFFKRLGYGVVQGYGMTETASLISLNHPFRAAEGSMGKVLPDREFKLAEDGEILVRGENVAAGYWERGALQPSSEAGWLHTGDLGELDAEGNLRFRGRKKNVIVTPAGLNVYPEDLEQALKARPEIRDAIVIPSRSGAADSHAELAALRRSGEAAAPIAILLPADRNSAHEGESVARGVAAANRGLAEYQAIRDWVVWPEADFPRTPTGKPRIGVIAKRVAQRRGGGKSVSAGNEANETIGAPRQSRAAINPVDEILQLLELGGKEARLEQELRLSSLDRVELLSALEQKYQVELNENAFSNAKTIEDLQKVVAQGAAPHAGAADFRASAASYVSQAAGATVSKAGVGGREGRFVTKRQGYKYPRWAQRVPIRWLRLAAYYMLVWPATQILGHPRIIGCENLCDVRGPVLVISNHITRRADIGLILAALPARIRHRLATAMGGETLRDMRHTPREWFFARRSAYWIGYWLVTALFNVFPLAQFSGVRESFRFAGESMDRGYSVLVFPEGVVNNSETGEMAPFQAGIGLLAQELRAPIVAMRLDGVWQMKRERRRLAHRGEITVRIGGPVTFLPGVAPQEIAATLQQIVREL